MRKCAIHWPQAELGNAVAQLGDAPDATQSPALRFGLRVSQVISTLALAWIRRVFGEVGQQQPLNIFSQSLPGSRQESLGHFARQRR